MRFPRSFSLSRHYERIHINPRFVKNKGKKETALVDGIILQSAPASPSTNEQSTENTSMPEGKICTIPDFKLL